MIKQFYFKQFSLAQVHRFNDKTAQFKTIQFSISTQVQCQNRSISNKTYKIVLFQAIQFSICTQFYFKQLCLT